MTSYQIEGEALLVEEGPKRIAIERSCQGFNQLFRRAMSPTYQGREECRAITAFTRLVGHLAYALAVVGVISILVRFYTAYFARLKI